MVKTKLVLGFVLLWNVCLGQVSTVGTLVAVVPANGGIITAADTRETVAGIYCDGQPKLLVPHKRKNTIVFETGQGTQLPLSKGARLPVDICAYVKSTRPLLDIAEFIVEEVDAKPNVLLTGRETHVIAEHCVSKVTEYAYKYKAISPLKSYLSKDMFRAVIVSYDPKRETGLLGSFVIRVDSSGKPLLDGEIWHEFLNAEKASDDLQYFGEVKYVDQYVFKLGQKSLAPFRTLFTKTVSQTTLSDATSAALSLITASEETAKIVTPPNGIGGPIDVATITKMGVALERH